MLELIICLGAGLLTPPLIILLFQNAGLTGLLLGSAVYLIGGYIIGKKLSTNHWIRDSIIFGVGAVIWGIMFILLLVWQPGPYMIFMVLVFSIVPTILSLLGAKSAVGKS